MAGSEQDLSGGILGLLDVLKDHREAVEYDLLRCGLRLDDLGTTRLSWHDAAVVVQYAQPGTAVWKALNPKWQQTNETDLMRSMDFHVRLLVWGLLTKRSDFDKPKPHLWPWEADVEMETRGFKGDAMTVEEMAHRLGWDKLPGWVPVKGNSRADKVPDDVHRAFPEEVDGG